MISKNSGVQKNISFQLVSIKYLFLIMLRIRNACFREVTDERSFYKTEKKKDFIIKSLKALELDPYL